MVDNEQAVIECDTTKGSFQMRFYRSWSPNGYDRAVELYERGFFDDSHFFRAVPNFLCQFGITYSNDPDLRQFMHNTIEDDPQLNPRIEFDTGFMSFAGSGPNSRTSQMFISYGKNVHLGENPWETPFGLVENGMEAVQNFYSYGDMPPWGKGPVQGRIHDGPQYINENFPLIDKFKKCSVERIRPGERGYVKDKIMKKQENADVEDDKSEDEDDDAANELEEEVIEVDGEEQQDDLEGDLEEEEEENDVENIEGEIDEDRSQERELKHLSGIRGNNLHLLTSSRDFPFSPKVGLVALGGVAVLVFMVKSFFQPSRKLSQKKN